MRGLAPGFYLRCPPVGAACRITTTASTTTTNTTTTTTTTTTTNYYILVACGSGRLGADVPKAGTKSSNAQVLKSQSAELQLELNNHYSEGLGPVVGAAGSGGRRGVRGRACLELHVQ